MKAYLLNNYYIFTNYDELSAHMYDVIHFAKPQLQNSSHPFTVVTGKINWSTMIFVNNEGESIAIHHEEEYDLYFSVEHEESAQVQYGK